MNEVAFDPSQRVDFYFRVSRDGTITITFLDANGNALDIANYDFQFLIKKLHNLETVVDATIQQIATNQIRVYVSRSVAGIKPVDYFSELIVTTPSGYIETWINGISHFVNKQSDVLSDNAVSVTVADGTNNVTLTINSSYTINNIWRNCGTYDASGNTFPSTGGTGTSGAIQAFNTFVLSVGGTLGGVYFSEGSILVALADNPGQTYTNWRIL